MSEPRRVGGGGGHNYANGDWQCSCGTSNWPSKSHCRSCGTPRARTQQQQQQQQQKTKPQTAAASKEGPRQQSPQPTSSPPPPPPRDHETEETELIETGDDANDDTFGSGASAATTDWVSDARATDVLERERRTLGAAAAEAEDDAQETFFDITALPDDAEEAETTTETATEAKRDEQDLMPLLLRDLLGVPSSQPAQTTVSIEPQQQQQQQQQIRMPGVYSLSEIEARAQSHHEPQPQEPQQQEQQQQQQQQQQEQQQPQPQQPTKPSLAALAARAATMGTPTTPPPFAPFMQDPGESDLWKGGRTRMREHDAAEVVANHFRMLFTWTPYSEDYYRLNYLAKNQLATRQQTHYLYQHKPVADCVAPFAPREAFPVPGTLGKILFTSSKKPRQTLQLFESEENRCFEVECIGEMNLDSHRGLLAAIEKASCWVLDIEDFDRLALSFSPSSRSASQPVLTQYLQRRTAACLSLATFFDESLRRWPSSFPAELMSIAKGVELFTRSLRVLPPEYRASLVPIFAGSLASIASSRLVQQQQQPVDPLLQRAQIDAARLSAEVLRRAAGTHVAATLRALSRFPPPAWPEMLRLPEALLVIGTALHRGVELNLHVPATAGSDVLSRLTASIGAALGGIPASAEAELKPEVTPEDRNASLLWCESFPYVLRGIVDSLAALSHWRVAAMSTMPPSMPPPPYPGAVWDILVATALVSSQDQRDVLRHVVGASVACGVLEQAPDNPAIMTLHQLLMHP